MNICSLKNITANFQGFTKRRSPKRNFEKYRENSTTNLDLETPGNC